MSWKLSIIRIVKTSFKCSPYKRVSLCYRPAWGALVILMETESLPLKLTVALPILSFSFCLTYDCCELILYAAEITILVQQKLYNHLSFIIFSIFSFNLFKISTIVDFVLWHNFLTSAFKALICHNWPRCKGTEAY